MVYKHRASNEAIHSDEEEGQATGLADSEDTPAKGRANGKAASDSSSPWCTNTYFFSRYLKV